MEKNTKILVWSIIICSILYLGGSFYAVSFNIADWADSTRELIASSSVIIVLMIIGIINVEK